MIRLRIDPNQYNDDNTTEDSAIAEARNKLFKVKHATNDTLYNNPNDPARNVRGHYVLTVGINPTTNDVGVAIITSLEDSHGNPIKEEQVRNGLILPFNNSRGLNRRSGLKQDVLVENPYTSEKINYSSLQNPSREIEIGVSEEEVAEFLFNNEQHTYKSHRNRVRTQNYIKIN